MSPFEFVMVLVSIIMGLGITTLLRGRVPFQGGASHAGLVR